MAEQLILVRGNDFVADVDHLHLLDDTDGITLERGGWAPPVALNGIVTEPFTLTVKGTSHDTLAAKLQGLEAKLKQIDEFLQATPEKYCVYLRDQATGETGARQALVTGWDIRPGHSYHSPNYLMEKYLLGLQCVAPWEATADIDKDFSAVSCHGGASAFAAVEGSAPARIALTRVIGASGYTTEIWAGFRTARFGTVANFVSPWQLEAAGSLGTDTAVATDATASPGGGGNTKLACTFATNAAMVQRARLLASDISAANYEDQRGTFDLILRAKVDSGVTAVVRLDSGWLGGQTQYGQNVTITSTAWKYYNVGRITWPPTGRITSYWGGLYAACVFLYAQRTAGSGSDALHLDCLVPIPVDEGSFHLSNFTAITDSFDGAIVIHPAGIVQALLLGTASAGIAGTSLPSAAGVTLENYRFPVGSAGNLIVAAQTASPALTDTVTVSMSYFKRYLSMRGAA